MSTTQFSSELRGQYKAKAYAAASAKSPLAPTTILRRDPGEHDVQIELLFCGICRTKVTISLSDQNNPYKWYQLEEELLSKLRKALMNVLTDLQKST